MRGMILGCGYSSYDLLWIWFLWLGVERGGEGSVLTEEGEMVYGDVKGKEAVVKVDMDSPVDFHTDSSDLTMVYEEEDFPTTC
jgi:hypothetical protein